LKSGAEQKPRFLLCELKKTMEGLFQHPARAVCIIAVPQVHLAQLESRGRRKKSTVASSLDAL
jgi:hypothetical protein